MSEVATVEMEAQKSRRKSTRVKKERIKDEEKPSRKITSGAVQKTKNSNGIAADSKKESKVSTRSSRVKHSANDTEDRTDKATVIPAVTRAADGKGKENVAAADEAERKEATRTRRASRLLAASTTKADNLEAVAASRVQDKASGAVRKTSTSVRRDPKASKLTPSRKEVSRRPSGASTGAASDRKQPSRNSNSRKSRKGPAHRNSCLTCSEDSYSDESHSCSCNNCQDSHTSSDGRDSVSCSCSDCEFEDQIRGKWKPASKKQAPKVVKEYNGIYTPD